MKEINMKKIKKFKVFYQSRYYPLEGMRTRTTLGTSPTDIRNNWHAIIGTDEYVIKKIEEVKSND